MPMADVLVYTKEGCPRCNLLKKRLMDNNILFNICDDEQVIVDKGYDLLPVMVVDGKEYDYAHAMQWLSERKQAHED